MQVHDNAFKCITNHSHIIRRFIGEPRIGSCEPVRSSSAYWVAGIRTKIRETQRTEVP